MYDPLALCVAVPSLAKMFVPSEYIVNGTVHRVYGVSKLGNAEILAYLKGLWSLMWR